LAKSRKSNFSVSHGTKSNRDLDWIWIPRYLAVQIQIGILFKLNLQLTKIFPQFRISIAFLPTFRVSSSRQRAVRAKHKLIIRIRIILIHNEIYTKKTHEHKLINEIIIIWIHLIHDKTFEQTNK
jgi:hypothetical protein